MDGKQIAAVIVPTALGLAPYILEKGGVAVPIWTISLGGIFVICALSYGVYFPIFWLLRRLNNHYPNSVVPLRTCISLVIVCVFGAVAINWWLVGWKNQPYDYRKWQSYKNEEIFKKHFINEVVEVDGKTFNKCKFTNATLFLHGLANFYFMGCSFDGNTYLKTDNQAATAFQALASFLKTQSNAVEYTVGIQDDKGNFITKFESGTKPQPLKKD